MNVTRTEKLLRMKTVMQKTTESCSTRALLPSIVSVFSRLSIEPWSEPGQGQGSG